MSTKLLSILISNRIKGGLDYYFLFEKGRAVTWWDGKQLAADRCPRALPWSLPVTAWHGAGLSYQHGTACQIYDSQLWERPGQSRADHVLLRHPAGRQQCRVSRVPTNTMQHFGLGAPSKAAPPHQNFWPKLEGAPAGKGLVPIPMAAMKPELL